MIAMNMVDDSFPLEGDGAGVEGVAGAVPLPSTSQRCIKEEGLSFSGTNEEGNSDNAGCPPRSSGNPPRT